MLRSKIAGVGYYVPKQIVTNNDLTQFMETSDEWIQERTGIVERRYAEKHKETTTTMGEQASRAAIAHAGIEVKDVDFIIFATVSPDYYFPGCGVLLQRALGLTGIGALDVRNQCTGFVYAVSIADQFIKAGVYKNILVVGSEFHSSGMDFSNRGRNVAIIFGDGAGAVVIQPTENEEESILTTNLHADGEFAEKLALPNPGSHGGYYSQDFSDFDEREPVHGGMFITPGMIENQTIYPQMEGQFVFKFAVQRMPEAVMEALKAVGKTIADLNMLIPHQANLRISQFVQKVLGLPDEKVFNNIQRFGNTTAASIPIALAEAWELGKVKKGDLVCLTAFGSGFTWGAALFRWAI